MNYEQFISAMLECVKTKVFDAELVEKQEILKNNGVIAVGLSVKKAGENTAPIIYLDGYYKKYCQGEALEELADHLVECIENLPSAPEWSYEDILDFRKIRHLVVYKLVNAERNQKLLKEVPNLPIMDLAIIFYVMISVNEFENGSVLIRNEHMNYWKMPISMLYQCAKENTPKLCPPVLRPLSDYLEGYMFGPVPESPLFMLSNENGINGASVLLYPEIPKRIFECVGKNYYLLPSSIHEFLIAPEEIHVNPAHLKEIVRDVNENHMIEEELLSDSIYYFNGNIITEM